MKEELRRKEQDVCLDITSNQASGSLYHQYSSLKRKRYSIIFITGLRGVDIGVSAFYYLGLPV